MQQDLVEFFTWPVRVIAFTLLNLKQPAFLKTAETTAPVTFCCFDSYLFRQQFRSGQQITVTRKDSASSHIDTCR